jgi:hypothetical protein
MRSRDEAQALETSKEWQLVWLNLQSLQCWIQAQPSKTNPLSQSTTVQGTVVNKGQISKLDARLYLAVSLRTLVS